MSRSCIISDSSGISNVSVSDTSSPHLVTSTVSIPGHTDSATRGLLCDKNVSAIRTEATDSRPHLIEDSNQQSPHQISNSHTNSRKNRSLERKLPALCHAKHSLTETIVDKNNVNRSSKSNGSVIIGTSNSSIRRDSMSKNHNIKHSSPPMTSTTIRPRLRLSPIKISDRDDQIDSLANSINDILIISKREDFLHTNIDSEQRKIVIEEKIEPLSTKRCEGEQINFKSNSTPPSPLLEMRNQHLLTNHDRLDFPTRVVESKDQEQNDHQNIKESFTQNDESDETLSETTTMTDQDNMTSMKPSPSASLSSNLMNRLNQLSLPVARKLKFWNKKSFQVNQYDPTFKVIYLGNLGIQFWSKEFSCVEKPLHTLWNNYLVNVKTEIVMRLTICNSGLKAITRQHGLTQYWSNRLVYCCSHKKFPKVFCWIYRHEGKKMRQELRCHAVLCPSADKATKMVTLLNSRLTSALQEFRREKKSRQNSRMNISNSSSRQEISFTMPLRKQILTKGSANFRPPLERSKSAPKLTAIVEEEYADD